MRRGGEKGGAGEGRGGGRKEGGGRGRGERWKGGFVLLGKMNARYRSPGPAEMGDGMGSVV